MTLEEAVDASQLHKYVLGTLQHLFIELCGSVMPRGFYSQEPVASSG